jgi:ATP-dependent Clp protease ATP-binding subunit ClpA
MTITKELEATLELAVAEAKRRHHEYLTLEHLLLALCADPVAKRILRGCGADLSDLAAGLEDFFTERLEAHADTKDPKQTPAFWRVLQRAAVHVQSAGKAAIDGGSVLVALMREHDSHSVYLLEKQGLTRLSVLRYVSHGTTKGAPEPASDEDETGEDDHKSADPLAAYTVNLAERAKRGDIDPLIGRVDEVARVTQVLCRRRKNNPVLVGDPGVGKTAIVEGLALAIHDGRVPQPLEGCTIYAVDMGAMLAGTKYRGEFEQRLKGVIKAVEDDPKAILFIDEIHTIVGAGATSGGSMDASNLLKPALGSGRLRCIGSTTFQEYKASLERDRALGRRFQKVEVYEPSVEETVQILAGLRSRYEEHHGARFADDALRSAAELAAKYVNDRYLPDKAIDVIDEAGSANRLLPQGEKREVVGTREIESVVAKLAKIPTQSVSTSDEVALFELEPSLKRVVFGQDAAIHQLVSAIKLSRAGLRPPDKPIGSFLFSGPTGVGKTELTKQLARVMGVEFLRFDMTEYMEKHTVSRLIGAPPGYVGFDQGGLLTDAVRRTPHAVLLLDEIEKAHPDLYGILLQVMDHATLTDNNGRKADFRHVIVVMTTNAGARDLTSQSLGFTGQAPSTTSKSKAAIERAFSPEFRNRLDAWIVFDALDRNSIDRVVGRQLDELAQQLKAKNVLLEVDAAARGYLGDKGFDPLYGARPLARLIESEIARPLADRILFGGLKAGGTVRVTAEQGKLALS